MGAEQALFQKFGKDVPKGTVLFQEGEPGREMFVVQSGKVAITRKLLGSEKVLAILGSGEFFGEMAIISNKPRNATAMVQEDAKVLVIDPKTFEAMIRGNSEIAVRLIKKLADRLAEADAQIENLLQMDPCGRIVHFILQRCQNKGRPTPGGIEIEFGSREQSQLGGVGEAALALTLARLDRAGLIARKAEQLTVYSVARLQDYLKYVELKWKFGDP